MTNNASLYPDFPAKPITVVLCGVGGQGAITAAHLLAGAAMFSGYDVKVSEIHGMAQRGGSVSTTVRFGENVSTMVCDPGCADLLISFETMEALRNLEFLKPGGHVIVNDIQIIPMPVLSGLATMPENIEGALKTYGADDVTLSMPRSSLRKPATASAPTWRFWVVQPRICPSRKKLGTKPSRTAFPQKLSRPT